jgi:hypothetical protein
MKENAPPFNDEANESVYFQSSDSEMSQADSLPVTPSAELGMELEAASLILLENARGEGDLMAFQEWWLRTQAMSAVPLSLAPEVADFLAKLEEKFQVKLTKIER